MTDIVEPETSVESVAMQPRRTRWVLWTAIGIGALLAALVVALAVVPSAELAAADSPLIGRPAPGLDAATIDGGHVNLRDYHGRWVLVNYFATWCVPCRKEHPDLVRFYNRHHKRGDVEIVGVVYNDSFSAVRNFRRDHGGNWPMAQDSDARIALEWGVAGVPETFVVDPDGVVRAKLVGGVTEAQLESVLVRVSGSR